MSGFSLLTYWFKYSIITDYFHGLIIPKIIGTCSHSSSSGFCLPKLWIYNCSVVTSSAHPTRPSQVISTHRILFNETLKVVIRVEFVDGALRVTTPGRPSTKLGKHSGTSEVVCQLHRCNITMQNCRLHLIMHWMLFTYLHCCNITQFSFSSVTEFWFRAVLPKNYDGCTDA